MGNKQLLLPLLSSCPEEHCEEFFSDELFARASRLVVFLAFVPVADVEEVFYAITNYIQTNYPRLMSIVNYFSEPQPR